MNVVKRYLSLVLRRIYWIVIIGILGAAGAVWFTNSPSVTDRAGVIVVAKTELMPTSLAPSTVNVNPIEQLQIIRQWVLTRDALIDLAGRLNIHSIERSGEIQLPAEQPASGAGPAATLEVHSLMAEHARPPTGLWPGKPEGRIPNAQIAQAQDAVAQQREANRASITIGAALGSLVVGFVLVVGLTFLRPLIRRAEVTKALGIARFATLPMMCIQAEVAWRRMMTWGGGAIATVPLGIGTWFVESQVIPNDMIGERVRGQIG